MDLTLGAQSGKKIIIINCAKSGKELIVPEITVN